MSMMQKEGEIKTNPADPSQRAVWRGGAWREIDQGGLEVMGEGYRRNPAGKVYREGPRGGFEQVGGPNDTMIREANEATRGVNAALAGIDRVDQQLRNTKDIGPFGFFSNNADLTVLEQSVRDLQLRLKEQPYNLGVLNGPDLMLIESIVSNPAQLKDAAFRKSILPRLNNLASILGEQYRNQAGSFGSMGGNQDMLPPLYQSPRSHYSPEQWGRQGPAPGTVPARRSGGGQTGRPKLEDIFK